MTKFQRVFGAGGLVLLGYAAAVLIGTNVTRCLGPLGSTYVQALANGCLEPGIGLGAPVFALWLAAAAIWLVQVPRSTFRNAAIAAVVGAAIAAAGMFVVTRAVLPTTVTGPTSTGEVITFDLPIDWNLIVAAAILGAATGLVAGSLDARRTASGIAGAMIAMLMVGLVAGCASYRYAAPSRPLGPGEHWLPAFPIAMGDGTPILCAGGGFIGDIRLHGAASDPRLAWIQYPEGGRQELVWPAGYSARFTPSLEVLDDAGDVIAREGSLATGGCPMPPDHAQWVTFEAPDQ